MNPLRDTWKTGMRTAAASLALLAAATPAWADAEPHLGEILTVAFTFCPRGFEATDGQMLRIASNTALYSLFGTTYGGDGMTTFALPAIPPVVAANGAPVRRCISMQGVYPPRP